jgi:hypothetical protein
MSDLAPLAAERQRMAYRLAACPPAEKPEALAEAWARLRAIEEARREIKQMVDEAALDHIREHGEFEIGDLRYYEAVDRDTRDADPRMTFEGLLAATGGDLDAVKECLASGAFKPGACRKVLDKDFERYFTVTEKPDVRTGKPKKKLQSTSLTFNRS